MARPLTGEGLSMYEVITLDLSQKTTGKVRLVNPGNAIGEIAVLQMPLGVSFQLAVGTGELFTVKGPFTAEPTGDDLQRRGLFWSNPAAVPGAQVELLVAYDDDAGAHR